MERPPVPGDLVRRSVDRWIVVFLLAGLAFTALAIAVGFGLIEMKRGAAAFGMIAAAVAAGAFFYVASRILRGKRRGELDAYFDGSKDPFE